MTQLAFLRSRLEALRRSRALVRCGTALSLLGVVVLGVLAADFLLDWTLEPARLPRALALGSFLTIVGVAFRRWAYPPLAQQESALELALLLERRQGIDSDLVAALQFESPEASRWGSAQLQAAVVDYVAEFSPNLDVFEGFSSRPLVRMGGVFGAALGVAGLLSVLFPAHASAFLNRLLLGARHYPTQTVIQQIVINGRPEDSSGSAQMVRCPLGHSVRFEVACSGELPASGRLHLTSEKEGFSTVLRLTRRTEPLENPDVPSVVYAAELPRLLDSVDYQLFIGDAWTDSQRLQGIPLPVIGIEPEVEPPEYASSAAQPVDETSGALQLSVLEGSRVRIRVVAINKPLESVTLKVGESPFVLSRLDDAGFRWELAGGETPFERVLEPIRYQVEVRDLDGLGLAEPQLGFIRLKADRGPRISAAVISSKVLPTGKPKISYGANDDYGIAKVRLIRQVSREGVAPEEETEDVDLIADTRQPQTQVRGEYALDLKNLKLTKGDHLKIVLEAIDFRGTSAGKSALSEPLLLQVTDVPGFLAAMAESDEQSARRIDAIIQRELGIGE